MSIKIWLTGDTVDLEYLRSHLSSGEVQVKKDGEKFYLAARSIDRLPQDADLRAEARRLVNLLCGLARLHDPACSPIGLSGSHTDDDGNVTVRGVAAVQKLRLVQTATAQARRPDGTIKPPNPPKEVQWLASAALDRDAAEVLERMGRATPPSFGELANILEIIEASGQLRIATRAAGISKAQLKRFDRTANHQVASGLEARHARAKTEPPKHPMSIGEARSMMVRLVQAWLDTDTAASVC